MNSISDIQHAFYINLDIRPDRKQHVEEQMAKIGINCQRFRAIKLENGAIGCSMSHLKILETAKQNNWDHVLIVEDDILFSKPALFVEQFNYFLSNHKDFDVLLLGGNSIPPYRKIDECCIKVTKCLTTTGYLVRNHYFDTLIQNYKEGIGKLLNDPSKQYFYAIDKYWIPLQTRDNWYLIIPLTVMQREDYSDIEKKVTNYNNVMTDLNKKAYFERIGNYKANKL